MFASVSIPMAGVLLIPWRTNPFYFFSIIFFHQFFSPPIEKYIVTLPTPPQTTHPIDTIEPIDPIDHRTHGSPHEFQYGVGWIDHWF